MPTMFGRLRTTAAALIATAVVAAGFTAGAAPAAGADAGLVLRYALDGTTGTTAVDSSGNGRDGTLKGGATLTGSEGLALDGSTGYVKLPDDVMAGLSSITVSTQVLVKPSQSTPYMLWAFGNTDSGGVGNGYLFATGDTYRAAVASGNWSTEQGVNSSAALARGTWKTLTYTIDHASSTAVLYLDGTEVARSTSVTTTPGGIGGGHTTADYIGRSVYSADKYLSGNLRDFRVYDHALTAAEIASLQPSDADRVQRDAAALSLGDLSAVTADVNLPTTGANGAAISWASSDPAISSTGTVTRPAAGSADVGVTLTATLSRGGASTTKAFTATVLALPSDTAAVANAAAALGITNIDDVRGNLTLPAAPDGIQLSWQSSNPDVVAADGVVHRQSADTDVTLTASLVKGTASTTRTFTAHVRAAVPSTPMAGYAFAYFTGDTVAGENIYFAASQGNNALKWNEVNGGRPVLTSQYGTKGLRDPFVIRSPEGDTFYLIATDLSIGSGTSWDASQRTGSLYLEVWESHDLVHWGAQRHVKVSPDNAGNTWAPEAYWDDTIGAYVVFWASKLYAADDPGHTGSTYNRMLYSTTRDFVTFSTPQIWQDGVSRIDSTVIKANGVYQRFTKDEGAGTTGCSDIIQESSTQLRATLPDWKMVASCIGKNAGTAAVEGPTVSKSNPGDVNGDKYYLFVDEYGGRGYIPLETPDIAAPNWKVSTGYTLPTKPRHGTVLPVTAAELAALSAGPAPAKADADGQILRYDFTDGSGSVVHDRTGNGHDGTIVGGTTWSSGSLALGGTDGYVDMPDDLLAGVTDTTVEADVWIDPAQTGSYFLYGFGNTDASGTGSGYLFTTGNSAYRTSIATGNWTTEQTVTQGSALPRGRWAHLAYTLQGGTARIYLDGVQVGVKTGVTTLPKDIGSGFTAANYLGRSVYSADKRFTGRFREFALYNRALTPAEILADSGNTTALVGASLTDPSVLKTDPVTEATGRTVVYPVKPGTDMTKLAPTFAVGAGVTASPASGDVVDLSQPVVYTLTAPDGTKATWTLRAEPVDSPVLPGLYADPNIAVFGGTYYIYATSDGYAGWGGNTLYVWKSTDLVNWSRSDKPVLTLDGANGNVPWATGNAWAPTIMERGGKYYLYFSGQNPTYNRKTIGVAVGDSPDGPFVAQPTAMILNNESVTSGQAIDPAAFKDPQTGKYYLFWGNGKPVYAELGDDMTSIKPGTIAAISGLTDFREGIFMNYRNGVYHLTYSIDDTGSPDYRVGYATSTSINGPWTARGVLLQKDPSQGILATGHSSIINVPGTDDWYIAYHRFAIPGGDGQHRETTIDRLAIGADGLFQRVAPTLSSVAPETVPDPQPLTVSIAGTPIVGRTLTASWSTPWTASTIGWTRDGAPIDGAHGATYTLTAADAGATVAAVVSGTKPLWPDATASAKVGPVLPFDVRLSVTTRCVADRVQLFVAAANSADTPLDVAVTTDFGTKTLTGLAAGATEKLAFPVKTAALPGSGGTAVVTGQLAGTTVSGTYSFSYDGTLCG